MKNRTASAAAVIVMSSLVTFSPAFAAGKHKKLTYEQALAHCKSQLNLSVTAPSTSHSHGYTAGAACMHKYGYRL
jgi:hypothetical protein